MKITTLKAHYAPRTISRVKARLAALGSIHAGKAQLGLDEAAYRSMVATASKESATSAADLDFRGRNRMIKALKAKGYKDDAPPSARSQELRQRRLRDLGTIHMGIRSLGMEDGQYRELVIAASSGKTRTSADMNARERSKLLTAMRKKGFADA